MATNARSVWVKVEYRRPFSGGSIGDHAQLSPTPIGDHVQLFPDRGAAERSPEKVERGRRWGSAKVKRGYRWSHRKKVGGTQLLPIQNAH